DHLAHELLDPALLELGRRLAVGRLRLHRFDRVLGVELAVTERQEELVEARLPEMLGDSLRVLLALRELCEREARGAHLGLEQLAPQIDALETKLAANVSADA